MLLRQIIATIYVEGVIILFAYQWLRLELTGGRPEWNWKGILWNSLIWPVIAFCNFLLLFWESKADRKDLRIFKLRKKVYRELVEYHKVKGVGI